MKILIIIPAYNEEENIEKVVGNIVRNFPQYDCLVVNDGSADRTGELCEKDGFSVLNLPLNLGIGGAVQAGYLYAKKIIMTLQFRLMEMGNIILCMRNR